MSLQNNLLLIFILLISTSCFAEESDFNSMDSTKHLQEARRYLLTNDIENAYKHLESIPLDSPEEIYKQRQELMIKIIRLEKDIRGDQSNNFKSYYQGDSDNKKEFIKSTPANAMLIGFIALSLMVGLPWLLLSSAIGVWASMWNHSFILFFVISIIVSPVLGAIIVLIIGKRKICPYCAEKIKIAAIICPYCRNNIHNVESIKPMKKLYFLSLLYLLLFFPTTLHAKSQDTNIVTIVKAIEAIRLR